MKTLEQIKNDYSVGQKYVDWEDLVYMTIIEHSPVFACDTIIEHENEVMKIYAMECLKLASERACIEPMGMMTRVDKQSITNENNIIK